MILKAKKYYKTQLCQEKNTILIIKEIIFHCAIVQTKSEIKMVRLNDYSCTSPFDKTIVATVYILWLHCLIITVQRLAIVQSYTGDASSIFTDVRG